MERGPTLGFIKREKFGCNFLNVFNVVPILELDYLQVFFSYKFVDICLLFLITIHYNLQLKIILKYTNDEI